MPTPVTDIEEHATQASMNREAKLTIVKAAWVPTGPLIYTPYPPRYPGFTINDPINREKLEAALKRLDIPAEITGSKILVHEDSIPKAQKQLFEVDDKKKFAKVNILKAEWESARDFYSVDYSGRFQGTQKRELIDGLKALEIKHSDDRGIIKVSKKPIEENFKTLFEVSSETPKIGASRTS